MRYLRIAVSLAFLVSLLVLGKTLYTVSKLDRVAPEIRMENGDEELHLSVSASEESLLTGLVATDDRDGDLTEKIMVERVSRFLSVGQCRVSYVVFDRAGNVGRFERKVVYDDYTAPRFTLSAPLMYRTGEVIRLQDRIKLVDALDGDLSHKIKIETYNVPEGEPGIFEFELSAVNNYGHRVHARIPLNVMDYTDDLPKIYLKEYLVYTRVGEKVDATEYVEKLVDCDGTALSLDDLRAISQVDVSKPGGGQIRLELTGKEDRCGIGFLTVIVEGE